MTSFTAGGDLKEWHKLYHDRGITASKGLYFGYVAGIVDGLIAVSGETYFNIPWYITVEDMTAVVDHYVTKNYRAIDDNSPAVSVIAKALNEKWPA